jgi:hypothetical protein
MDHGGYGDCVGCEGLRDEVRRLREQYMAACSLLKTATVTALEAHETINRVDALCRNIDRFYSLLDDNSADENRGKVRLFLALDDVRAALVEV